MEEGHGAIWVAIQQLQEYVGKLETHARLLDKSVSNLEDFIYGDEEEDNEAGNA